VHSGKGGVLTQKVQRSVLFGLRAVVPLDRPRFCYPPLNALKFKVLTINYKRSFKLEAAFYKNYFIPE
jgi:hypothetical protein